MARVENEPEFENNNPAHELAAQHGGYWEGQHPEYPHWDWLQDVAQGNTRLGYWEWVAEKRDSKMWR